jgi:lysophospholipase L1-like esterase
MPEFALLSPDDLLSTGDHGPPDLNRFGARFLAQGDSWFSLGSVIAGQTTNLLMSLRLRQDAVAVNCARPGKTLSHMTDTTSDSKFLRLLRGRQAWPWTALLISGGGNDLIDACQVGPRFKPEERIFATPGEWNGRPSPDRYLSEAGWNTFADHLRRVLARLVAERDRDDLNRGIPIVLHDYDRSTPRPAPAGPFIGPWLYPAVKAFSIPEQDWLQLAQRLQAQLGELLRDIAAEHPAVFVINTQGQLQPAGTQDVGPTLHWQNEIHPTAAGYRVLGRVWEAELNGRFFPEA